MKSRGVIVAVVMAFILQVEIKAQSSLSSGDPWVQDRPVNLPQIKNLEVMCAKDHMEVQLSFDKPFTGLVFSKGQFGSDNCVYVQPKSGRQNFRFSITYQGCGTKPDAKGKFYENTVVVQYDEELIEVWDEAKRLRCEWYNDYEKTATKPPMVIADLEVVELNFRGDNVDCWMEIQNGKGPWASPITGIVPLGSTLTMVVAINDHAGEFDMRVKSCEASDGVNRPIQLSDERGCVLRPKMVSKFLKLRSNDGRSTVMSYAFFHAFKFPDSLQVYIRCKVEICRFGCPEHCDKSAASRQDQEAAPTIYAEASFAHAAALKAPEALVAPQPLPPQVPVPSVQRPTLYAPLPEPAALVAPQAAAQPPPKPSAAVPVPVPLQLVPQPIPQRRADAPQPAAQQAPAPAAPVGPASGSSSKRPLFRIAQRPASQMRPPKPFVTQRRRDEPQAQVMAVPISMEADGQPPMNQLAQDPVMVPLPVATVEQVEQRHAGVLDVDDADEATPARFAERIDLLPIPKGPRSLNLDDVNVHIADIEKYATQGSEGRSRKRRSYALHERRVRSADVGVRVGYEVISAVDLAFTPNASSEGITIFQSRMKAEEVVYGICLPAPGFSALFVLLAMCVVISVLVASFLCYHRQLQKADREGVCSVGDGHSSIGSTVLHPQTRMQFFGARHQPNPKGY